MSRTGQCGANAQCGRIACLAVGQAAWKRDGAPFCWVVEGLAERAVRGEMGFRFQEQLKIYLTQLLAF